LRQAAIDVFAFDALIQNPDRRRDKPNVLWKGDELNVIDHEMAFSFLFALVHSARQWSLDDQAYLKHHIFYQQLAHSAIDLARITGAIEAVNATFWTELERLIPIEWKGTNFGHIRRHVESVQQNLDEFMNDVRRILQ
jgi:hypothetical protein